MTRTSVLTKPYPLISFIPSVGTSEVTISESVVFGRISTALSYKKQESYNNAIT